MSLCAKVVYIFPFKCVYILWCVCVLGVGVPMHSLFDNSSISLISTCIYIFAEVFHRDDANQRIKSSILECKISKCLRQMAHYREFLQTNINKKKKLKTAYIMNSLFTLCIALKVVRHIFKT